MEEPLLEHTGSKEPSAFSHFDCFDHLTPLKCPSCEFSTEFLILLRYHLVRNHDQQQFTLKAKQKMCKKCRFCTHSNYLWIRHPIFGTCKGKKESKGKEKKVIVLRKRDGKWYLCENCDYRNVDSRHLKNHVISKHTPLKEINWQNCKKCPGKYKTLDALKRHQKWVHGSAVDHFNCPECDYSTPSRHNLRTHVNRKHARPEDIKWVECYHCDVKFKDKVSLMSHLKQHTTEEKQFKCDRCPYETRYKHNLKPHIASRHTSNSKKYKCDQCPFKTHYKYCLENHIVDRLAHSPFLSKDEKVNWYKCQHCSFKTKRNSNLRKHINRFHDDSLFKCDLCNYRAKCEETVEIHKKNKHENSCDVKLFKCEHCNYSFKLKHNLEKHILAKHNIDWKVLNCKECDYKTYSKEYLTGHITRMHKRDYTQEEKLNCPHCSYFCFNELYLKKHLNLHLSVKQLSWITKIS